MLGIWWGAWQEVVGGHDPGSNSIGLYLAPKLLGKANWYNARHQAQSPNVTDRTWLNRNGMIRSSVWRL
jgi:hypothetical protein